MAYLNSVNVNNNTYYISANTVTYGTSANNTSKINNITATFNNNDFYHDYGSESSATNVWSTSNTASFTIESSTAKHYFLSGYSTRYDAVNPTVFAVTNTPYTGNALTKSPGTLKAVDDATTAKGYGYYYYSNCVNHLSFCIPYKNGSTFETNYPLFHFASNNDITSSYNTSGFAFYFIGKKGYQDGKPEYDIPLLISAGNVVYMGKSETLKEGARYMAGDVTWIDSPVFYKK